LSRPVPNEGKNDAAFPELGSNERPPEVQSFHHE
jgi:hypothetical protein